MQRMPAMPLNPTSALRVRFWGKVAKGDPDDCWMWSGCFRNGYGAIKHNKKVFSAHRVAYVLKHGEPSDSSLVVGHKCDCRACCNPKHLHLITCGQNNRDASERGLIDRPKGEAIYNAVLNEQMVSSIWQLRRKKLGKVRIARALHLNEATVGAVLQGKTWKHLTPAWARKQTAGT